MDVLWQGIALQAAGVEPPLNEKELAWMKDFFRRRNRTITPNDRKQPATAEIIDNRECRRIALNRTRRGPDARG